MAFYKLSQFSVTQHITTLSQRGCSEKGWRSFIPGTGQKETEVLPPVYRKWVCWKRLQKCILKMSLCFEKQSEQTKNTRRILTVYLCWKVVVVLMWSGDLFSILNCYRFSVSINYPSMLHFKNQSKTLIYFTKAPKHAVVL